MKVPDILLSGDHGKIDDWRLEQALKRTYERRPDMLTGLSLSGKAKQMLADIKADESEV
jgi:tRNA (guanine37-N1)-methyltransferase